MKCVTALLLVFFVSSASAQVLDPDPRLQGQFGPDESLVAPGGNPIGLQPRQSQSQKLQNEIDRLISSRAPAGQIARACLNLMSIDSSAALSIPTCVALIGVR